MMSPVMHYFPAGAGLRRFLMPLLLLTVAASLTACGVVAAPVRVSSAAVKTVPVAGHVVAAPMDVTADTID
jgi:hypothetical protein